MQQKVKGFTLVELIITVVIVAIIAGIAIPSYFSYAAKSRRADGINTLLSISLAEERYRSANTTYGTLAQINASTTSPQGFYTIAVTNNTATSYTITATAQGQQANDADSGVSCTTLTLTMSNGTLSKTPTVCWPS